MDKYYAEKASVKLKFPAKESSKSNKPYGLYISPDTPLNVAYKYAIMLDLSAYRPDIRDNSDFMKDVVLGNVEIVVLYEKVKYTTDTISMFPRYILYEDTIFTNIR